jgi:hypothetical protein
MSRIRFLACFIAVVVGACDGEGPSASVGLPEGAVPDSVGTPPDSTGGPGVDTIPPPNPDSTLPPPSDSGGTVLPPYQPTHVGIPFGPYFVPPNLYGTEYTGTYRPRQTPATLLSDLEAARRTNTRVILNLTGNEHGFADDNGFNFELWKRRIEGFRGLDFSSYIADGTVVGHLILDEPQDRSNWHGNVVTPAQIDELARYSKELWPGMPTIVRAWPDYLIGHTYQYLDATWAQYCPHCGNSKYRLPIEAFITQMVRDARGVGLGLVGGLNVLDGGSGSSGIPGHKDDKFAMSANEIRTWGAAYLAEPYICGFLMWEYEEGYFSRPDIKEVIAELKEKATNRPKKECRPGG